jgi:hypothetical protein
LRLLHGATTYKPRITCSDIEKTRPRKLENGDKTFEVRPQGLKKRKLPGAIDKNQQVAL